ncbi:MAG: hypothetical protein QNJ09_02155 [Paracoccaceae bacterium]|nr:hypothetical protein [Paracoccaceae bacterium]
MDDEKFRQTLADILEKLSKTPEKEDTTTKDAIKRIEKVSTAARSNWFWFFGILAYAAITLMGVKDVDFFTTDKTTTLPVLNFPVNLLNFMIFAPALIAVIYAYLHGLIEQLWDDLAKIERTGPDGKPIISQLPVWLLIEAALLLRHLFNRSDNPPVRTSLLGYFGIAATVFMVWLAAPMVTGWFWLRSMVMHDTFFSAVLGGVFLFCLVVFWFSITTLLRVMWSAE